MEKSLVHYQIPVILGFDTLKCLDMSHTWHLHRLHNFDCFRGDRKCSSCKLIQTATQTMWISASKRVGMSALSQKQRPTPSPRGKLMMCRRTCSSCQTVILKLVTIIKKVMFAVLVTAGQGKHTEIETWKGSQKKFTFGEHLKCIPGTGSVVTYIVIQRYRYSVPTIQKNLLLIIDLEEKKWRDHSTQTKYAKVNKLPTVLHVFETRDSYQHRPENTEIFYKCSHALQVRNTRATQLTLPRKAITGKRRIRT